MNTEVNPMDTQEDINKAVEEAMENRPKRHNLEPFKDSSRTRVLRFWLNVVFMIGAIAGLIVYFKVDRPFIYAISEVSTGAIVFIGIQKQF